MLKIICGALLCVFLMGAVHAEEADTPWHIRQKNFGVRGNHIEAFPKLGRIVFLGEINDRALSRLKDIFAQGAYAELWIDSPGGEIRSAMQIAQLIERHKLRLVVDGDCLSACATYLYVSAPAKRVLPHSVVGIHGRTFFHRTRQQLSVFSSAEFDAIADPALRAIAEEDGASMERFLLVRRIKLENFRAFEGYVKNRRKIFATASNAGNSRCPNIGMWLLDQKQLEAMGVTGIEEFWFPRSSEEKTAVQRHFSADYTLFYGDREQLKRLCSGINAIWPLYFL